MPSRGPTRRPQSGSPARPTPRSPAQYRSRSPAPSPPAVPQRRQIIEHLHRVPGPCPVIPLGVLVEGPPQPKVVVAICHSERVDGGVLSACAGGWRSPVHNGCVSRGAGDGQAEQVGEGAEIVACGDGLVEESVEADLLAGHAELIVGPGLAHRSGMRAAADVDEQVRVDGGGPGRAAMVEVGAQPLADGTERRGVVPQPAPTSGRSTRQSSRS